LLLLFKDQKGSFGLTISQHDNATWIQSVQPHGSADQVSYQLNISLEKRREKEKKTSFF